MSNESNPLDNPCQICGYHFADRHVPVQMINGTVAHYKCYTAYQRDSGVAHAADGMRALIDEMVDAIGKLDAAQDRLQSIENEIEQMRVMLADRGIGV